MVNYIYMQGNRWTFGTSEYGRMVARALGKLAPKHPIARRIRMLSHDSRMQNDLAKQEEELSHDPIALHYIAGQHSRNADMDAAKRCYQKSRDAELRYGTAQSLSDAHWGDKDYEKWEQERTQRVNVEVPSNEGNEVRWDGHQEVVAL